LGKVLLCQNPGATVASSATSTANAATDTVKIKPNLRHYYPTFDGCLEKYTMFKHKFLAVAVMHGHGKILEKGYMVPSNPADGKIHDKHGNVMHSAALILGSSMTLPEMEPKRGLI
jgi:hypothetical protein